jgi:hypothetical protein
MMADETKGLIRIHVTGLELEIIKNLPSVTFSQRIIHTDPFPFPFTLSLLPLLPPSNDFVCEFRKPTEGQLLGWTNINKHRE